MGLSEKSKELLQSINGVPGFKPEELLRPLSGDPARLYLHLAEREAWFRLKYPDGKINVEVLEIRADQTVIARCTIYPSIKSGKREYLSRSTGAYTKADVPEFSNCPALDQYPEIHNLPEIRRLRGLNLGQVIEFACSHAEGRALKAAGFSTQIAMGGPSDVDDDSSEPTEAPPPPTNPPPDKSKKEDRPKPPELNARKGPAQKRGRPPKNNPPVENPEMTPGMDEQPTDEDKLPSNHAPLAQLPETSKETQAKPGTEAHEPPKGFPIKEPAGQEAAPSEQEPMPSGVGEDMDVQALIDGMSLEEAAAVVITCIKNEDKGFGKTMGWLAAKKPRNLAWIAETANERQYAREVAAARVLLSEAGKRLKQAG